MPLIVFRRHTKAEFVKQALGRVAIAEAILPASARGPRRFWSQVAGASASRRFDRPSSLSLLVGAPDSFPAMGTLRLSR